MKFVHYIRDQMMQEYGFDLNDFEENGQLNQRPFEEFKKLKDGHKDKVHANNNLSRQKQVIVGGK